MRTEDGYIIRKCLDGDSAAFGILVDKYKGGIYALAYSRLRNFHDAEDVTQEVFVKAYQKLRILRRWDNFHAWLYAITSNLCKDWIRSRSRRPDREFIEDEDPGILEIRSLDSYREKRTRQALDESLHEALDSLPEIHRQVLMLFYLGGMSGKEIAAFLGVSPNTIRQRLYRARAQLKEEMLAMMEGTFEAQRLQAGFTIRIVEILKRTRIHAMPRTTGLPWGLSLATGVILAVLSIGSHINLPDFVEASIAPALSSETAVAEVGEIAVDILKTSEISTISSKQGDGDGGKPEPRDLQNELFMAPHREGGTWTKMTDMLTPRWGLSAVVVNGKIYAIGGTDGEQFLSTVEEYDPAEDRWTAKSDMPTERMLPRSDSAVDGKIYAIGGLNDDGVLQTVEEYTPALDTWRKRADMPTARTYLSTSVVNGKIYAIGGVTFVDDDVDTFFSTIEEYDPATDTWTRKADMPTARGVLGTAVVNGKIYAIGGIIGEFGPDGTVLPTVEEYDPVSDVWVKRADLPTAVNGFGISVVNGKIYIVGGFGPIWKAGSSMLEYDPMTGKCIRRDDVPTPRAGPAAAAVNGRIYAIGGMGSWITGRNQFAPLASLEEYNPGFVNIEEKGKLPTKWGEVKSD